MELLNLQLQWSGKKNNRPSHFDGSRVVFLSLGMFHLVTVLFRSRSVLGDVVSSQFEEHLRKNNNGWCTSIIARVVQVKVSIRFGNV